MCAINVYDMSEPVKKDFFNHHQKSQAGKTLKWFGSDNQETYQENIRRNLEKMSHFGWVNGDDAIQYRVNRDGFRDEEFDDRPAGIALGCSMTMGVGVHEQHTWPRQLSKLLGIHIWNLGVGGGTRDTCFRILDHYIDILKPKFVVYQQPSIHRLEFYDSSWRQVISTDVSRNVSDSYRPFLMNWFLHDENSIAQGRKTKLASQYRCYETNTPLFFTSGLKNDCGARDLMHPGRDSLERFAEQIYNERHLYLRSGQKGDQTWS